MKPGFMFLTLFALAATALLTLAAAPGDKPPVPVSMVRLLADPEAWDGREVDITGFVRFESGQGAIYFHEADEEFGLTLNALRLDLSGTESNDSKLVRRDDFAPGIGRYAFVRGTFDAGQRGPHGDLGGSLRNVRQLRPWAAPEPGELAGATDRPREIPLVRLLANPREFDGHWVMVTGPVSFEFEGTAIYFETGDPDSWSYVNRIWLSLTPQQRQAYAGKEGKIATVAGVFDAACTGHMGMFSGCLENVEIVDVRDRRPSPEVPAKEAPK